MSLGKALAIAAGISLCSAAAAQPQPAPRPAPVGFPDAPGKEVVVGKCFQCHAPTMWTDLRQDRRAWEGTIYRMIGRGALWTPEEIRQMSDYLGSVYGRKP